MTNEYSVVANKTGRLAERINKRFPHLRFAVWDLSDFLPFFHNVRRTMIFIECGSGARKEVRAYIGEDKEFHGHVVYEGERKPKAVNAEWIAGRNEIWDAVVIMARDEFGESELLLKKGKEVSPNVLVPCLERRLVDLMVYALRDWLPVSVEEASAVFAEFAKTKRIRYGIVSRYATRRYIGWFLNMVLFRLSEKGVVSGENIDPKILESGKRAWKAVKEVEKI